MISVIIPFKNAELYVGRCAQSLKQRGDFEFIFVNDHSTDGGADIVDRFAAIDPRYRLVENTNKRGVGGARNAGIEAARGEWLTFLDVDDEFTNNAYDTFTSAIASDPRANVHQFNHWRYYTKIKKLAFKYTNEAGVYSSERLPQCWYGVWNKLYRLDFLTCRFNENIKYGEDGLFVLECLALDDYIRHAPYRAAVVKHRFDNPHSLSKSKRANDLIRYAHELEKFVRRAPTPQIKKAACNVLAEEWHSKVWQKKFCDE